MTTLHLSSAIVRAWTRLYTWRLPARTRDTRRAEIDSDLWEFTCDRETDRGVAPALHVMVGSAPMRAAISVGTAVIVATAVWVYAVTAPVDLPAPVPLVKVVDVYPPPPPPPPPPPRVIRRTSWTIVIHPAPPPSR